MGHDWHKPLKLMSSPPLLLIFFHDKGWLAPQPTSGALAPDPSRTLSPTSSAQTSISRPSTTTQGTRSQHHFEFLLFAYLLRFVHRESGTGQLARAGLLLLFDIAFLTATEEGGDNLFMPVDKDGNDPLQDARDAFGEYILDGDFADVMAAGLGAVWSMLPSKLEVPTLAESAASAAVSKDVDGRNGDAIGGVTASQSGGMHLGATIEEDTKGDSGSDLRLSTDDSVREQLGTLVTLLGFVQDIIHRCDSPLYHVDANDSNVSNTHVLGSAISEATLDAVHTAFIDNVVYPSILECSPNDGSAVAVMTYIEVILSNLDDGPLLRRILTVLMDNEDAGPSSSRPRRGAGQDMYADEERFTLKDLILDNIASRSPASSTAAFRLLRTLLLSHCGSGVQSLIRTVRDPSATAMSRRALSSEYAQTSFLPNPVTSTDVNLQEVELYGSLITRIDPLQSSAELTAGYSTYLADMHAAIQADKCFIDNQIPLQFVGSNDEDNNSLDGEEDRKVVRIGEYNPDPFQHRMSPGDPLVSALLELFGDFLCQTPDENVALTGVLAALTLCPNRSLAGWLVYDTPPDGDPWVHQRRVSSASATPSDASLDDAPAPFQQEEDPFTARQSVELPAVYQVLRELVRQINRFRLDVDDFDRLLSERRQGLLFTDHLDEAMNVMLEVEPSAYGLPTTPTKVVSPAPKKATRPSLVGGLKSFLTPKRKASPATPSRSSPAPGSGMRPAAGELSTTSPFKAHYEQTTYFSLEAHASSPVASGPWSPARQPKAMGPSRPKSAMSSVDSVSILSGNATAEQGASADAAEDGPKRVTLSSVLDNCVILEEFLKEMVAVITARRALGIDQVGFVLTKR